MKKIIKCEICGKQLKDDDWIYNSFGYTTCQECYKGLVKEHSTVNRLQNEISDLQKLIDKLRIIEFNTSCVVELLENKQKTKKLNVEEQRILEILKGEE